MAWISIYYNSCSFCVISFFFCCCSRSVLSYISTCSSHIVATFKQCDCKTITQLFRTQKNLNLVSLPYKYDYLCRAGVQAVIRRTISSLHFKLCHDTILPNINIKNNNIRRTLPCLARLRVVRTLVKSNQLIR